MKHKPKPNWGVFIFLLLLANIFVGCILTSAVVIHYLATDDGYVATADAKKNADEIWQAITHLAGKLEADGSIEILKRENSERLLKITDKDQTADIKVLAKKEGGQD